MRQSLPAFVMILATPAFADVSGLQDLHLSPTPRTEAEADRIASVLAPPTGFTAPERFEGNPGGAGTVSIAKTPFSHPAANLPDEQDLDFLLGEALFQKLWVSSPSSTKASDGLGPLFNARSCQTCHIEDGRGHPPQSPDDATLSMLVRLSVPAPDDTPLTEIEAYLANLNPAPRTRPEPNYGGQLQEHAVFGVTAEAKFSIDYTEFEVPLAGGETATLRNPSVTFHSLGMGDMHPDTQVSARVAPPMTGLGLIDAIPTADILALADPDDTDGDGISGRAQVTWSAVYDAPMLGRYGWKAGNPTVLEQSAAAFSGDIGISTPLFPNPAGDCTDQQTECLDAPHGDKDVRVFEIDAPNLDLVTLYSANLAVPARRNLDDPRVLRGKEMFHNSGCAACHQPKFVTHRLPDSPQQSFQLIWPYSDFLLHDMGEGLADNRPELRATGQEWRTPPLWGIGLAQQVDEKVGFLHDGRARTLLEAVLWHGGEAETSKSRVVDMSPADRDALIQFLESL